MQYQKIYDELVKLKIKLYQNEKDGLLDATGVAEQLLNILDNIIEREPSKAEVVQQSVEDLYNSLFCGDVLQAADSIAEIISILDKYEIQNFTGDHKKRLDIKVDRTFGEFYQHNIMKMENSPTHMYDNVVKWCLKNEIQNYDEILIDTEGNMAVNSENRWWRLNSLKDREDAVEIAIQEIKDKNYISQLYIFGLGNMDYVNQILLEIPEDTAVFIYEPDSKIFQTNLKYRNMERIFQRQYTCLFVEDINAGLMESYVSSIADAVQTRYLYTFVSPAYDSVYLEQIEKKVQSVNTAMEIGCARENTIVDRNSEINYARIMNLSLLYKSTSLLKFKEKCIKDIDVEDIPVIIVAAGPSLDKNIHQLKLAQGKAFIIAVDSAIRMLEKYNIKPDAYVTLDAIKPAVLFENKIAKETPIFYCGHSSYNNIKDLQGKKIFIDAEPFMGNVLKSRGKEAGEISPGGSVANAAFAIAQFVGFKNIIMVGLDLAFAEDKKHASVVYNEKSVKEEESSKYTYVDGIHGEKLLTYQNFILYKEWYERKLENSDVKMINATEGGAKIKGAENVTLQEAIKRYCVQSVDIGSIIQSCDNIFQLEEKKSYMEMLYKLKEECVQIKKYYHQCLKWYMQIQNKKNIVLLKKTMKKIRKADIDAQCFFVNEIVSDYASEETENVYMHMYAQAGTEESQWTEINQNIENGILVTKALICGAEKAVDNFEKCIKVMNEQ